MPATSHQVLDAPVSVMFLSPKTPPSEGEGRTFESCRVRQFPSQSQLGIPSCGAEKLLSLASPVPTSHSWGVVGRLPGMLVERGGHLHASEMSSSPDVQLACHDRAERTVDQLPPAVNQTDRQPPAIENPGRPWTSDFVNIYPAAGARHLPRGAGRADDSRRRVP